MFKFDFDSLISITRGGFEFHSGFFSGSRNTQSKALMALGVTDIARSILLEQSNAISNYLTFAQFALRAVFIRETRHCSNSESQRQVILLVGGVASFAFQQLGAPKAAYLTKAFVGTFDIVNRLLLNRD